MKTSENKSDVTGEQPFKGVCLNGFLMIFLDLILIAVSVALMFQTELLGDWIIILSIIGFMSSMLLWAGITNSKEWNEFQNTILSVTAYCVR